MYVIRFDDGSYYAGGSCTVVDDNGLEIRNPLLQIKDNAKRFKSFEVAKKIAETINGYTKSDYPVADVEEV